jgi:spoIIIJ-associated protein
MDQAEASGKTVDDALNAALRKIGATRDEVEFTVLDEGKRGMLFVKGRDAMVRVVRTTPAASPEQSQSTGEDRGRSRRGRRGGGGGGPAGDAPPERGAAQGGPRRERGGTAAGRDRAPRGAAGGGRGAGRRSFEEAVPKLTEADFAAPRGTEGAQPDGERPAARGGGRDRDGSRGQRTGRRERGDRPESRDSRGPRRPEVHVEPNIDAPEVDLAATVVDDLLRMFEIDADITLREPVTPGDGLGSALAVIDIGGEDLGVLIGRRGDTLLNLQYLVNLILNRRYPGDASVTIDVEHYRHRREEQLTELAMRMAERVKEHGNPITLEPMPASERRLVHLALAEDNDLETNSIGEGDDRKVVISPKGYR